MTRKDFVLIAQTIAGLGVEPGIKELIAQRFTEVLDTQHPFFDAAKFLNAATTAD